MEAIIDGRDSEVEAHISHFISRLPQMIQLDRVLALSLEDPAAALATLNEVRAAIENERRKVKALLKLAEQESASLKDQIEVITSQPVVFPS